MARTVNPQLHAAKRDQIVSTAQRLIYMKGFEHMTIQDVLDALAISQGAFYHYFSSKADLLEAVVTHLLREAVAVIGSIVDDAAASAPEKLRRYFVAFFAWRNERKDVLLTILPVWYRDENAVVRQKVRAAMLAQLSPLVATMLRQGIDEGAYTLPHPDQTAQVLVTLRMALSEALAALLLTLDPAHDDLAPIAATVTAYADAIERVVGAPQGSLPIADADVLSTWFG